jgi:hypothetical protein
MADKESGPPPLGAFASSVPPPPPARSEDEEEAAKRFKSTLVGVPASTPPPRPSSPPPAIAVPAPPPWRGVEAYADGQIPELRQSAVPPPPEHAPVVAHLQAAPAPAVPPGSPALSVEAVAAGTEASSAPTPSGGSIRDSIERMLDEQLPSGAGAAAPATAEASPLGGATRRADDSELEIETVLEDDLEDYHSEPPAPRSMPPAKTPSGRPIALSMPVPAGAVVSDRGSDKPLAFVPLDSVRPPAATAAVQAAPPLGSLRSAPPPIVPDPLSPPPPEPPLVVPGLGGAALASDSLASRVAPDLLRPPSVAPAPSSAGVGLLYVGLMVVLGVGGYMLTRGGFVPQRMPEARPPAAVAAPPLAPVPAAVQPGTETPPLAVAPVAAPVPAAVAPAAVAPPAAAPPVPVPALPEPAAVAVPAPAPAPVQTPPPAPAPVATRAPAPAVPVAARATAPASAPVQTPPAARAPVAVLAPAPAPAPVQAPPPAPAPVATTLQPITAPEPLGPIRDKPTREDVQTALEGVRASVAACAPGKRGTAQVDITVASTGVVTKALVGGDFAGTPEGSCIARAVRGAKLPTFSQPTFRVIYPFAL